MFGLGVWELLLILFVVLLIFGGKRLPELGSALGKSIGALGEALPEKKKDDEKESESGKAEKQADSVLNTISDMKDLRTTSGKLRLLGKIVKK